MGRNRRARGRTRDITEAQWAYINDADLPEGTPSYERYELDFNTSLSGGGPLTSELWSSFGDVVVDRWAVDRPGTRPSCWWRFSSKEPRERLSGVGDAASDVLAYVPALSFGLPALWVSEQNVARYGPSFRGRAPDPNDPPSFESQAAYLRRLNLLRPREIKSIPVARFEPEAIVFGEAADPLVRTPTYTFHQWSQT